MAHGVIGNMIRSAATVTEKSRPEPYMDTIIFTAQIVGMEQGIRIGAQI